MAAAFAVLVVTAGPAAAHAELEETDPASGAGLERAPDRVTLRFSEAVEVSLGSVRVFDDRGERVDHGEAEHPEGRAGDVAVDLPDLVEGAYVVTWRVVSSDSHPVQGAFTFAVGDAAPAADDLSARLLASRGGSSIVGAAFTVDRVLAFASLLLLVGSVVLVATVWPAGLRSRPLRRLVFAAWAALFAASVLAVGLQGAYAGGLTPADAFTPSVYDQVLGTRYGTVYAARLVLLLLALPVLVGLLGRPWPPVRTLDRTWRARSAEPARPTRMTTPPAPPTRATPPTSGRRAELGVPGWWPAAAVVIGLGLAATPGLAGHATSGMLPLLAIPADALHVASAGAWIGGLVVLVVCVFPRARGAELERAVTGFSTLAASAVAVIVVTGAFQGWRQAGSLSSLTSTSYGRLLLAKSAVVAATLGVATLSRSAVHRRWRSNAGRARRPPADDLQVPPRPPGRPRPPAPPGPRGRR